tara:strand:- start:1318 stop:1518 length:201 start_codon:yes stop_codon:yes gene_type:complete
MVEFLSKHSNEIFCWSWALGVCGLLFIIMMLIDTAWNVAYQKGFERGVDYANRVDESLGDGEHYYS